MIRQYRRFSACLFFLLVLCLLSAEARGETEANYILIPFPIYTPETKAALTLTALYHSRDIDSSRVSTLMAFAAYSQLKQFRLAGRGQSYFADGLIHAAGGVGFADWPDKFFGLGTDNTEDDQEDFTSKSVNARIAIQFRIFKHLMAGGAAEFKSFDITERQPGGLLDTAGIRGAQGGDVFGFGPVVTYDSRDDSFFPRKGHLSQVSAILFPQNPGDYKFQRYRADLRQYVPVGEKGVIAFQEYVNVVRGDVPFQYLSQIGDMGGFNLMRGYFSGIFRERDVAAIQVEYRTHIWKKLGGAVFASAGVIGNDLLQGRDLAVKPAGGLGLRYCVGGEESINLRLDFALGEDSSGVYFNILESF